MLQLPTELIKFVTTMVDYSDILVLMHTNKYFYETLSTFYSGSKCFDVLLDCFKTGNEYSIKLLA